MYICVKVRLGYQLESLTDLLALFEISKIFKRGKYILYIYVYSDIVQREKAKVLALKKNMI